MTPKQPSPSSKASLLRPVPKRIKGASETARLFINVDGLNQRTQTQALPVTRHYVE